MADSSRKYQYLPTIGDPLRPVGFSSVLRCTSMWYAAAGGGGEAGRRPRISQEWRMVYVNSNIYRPAGVRSDPWASRRFRFSFHLATWRRSAGGGQKRWMAAKNNAKWRTPVVNIKIYRTLVVRSDPLASRRLRILGIFCTLVVVCRLGTRQRAVSEKRRAVA